MAIKEIDREWCVCQQKYRSKYVVDSEADIVNLPETAAGGIAMVASTGKIYMMNASNEWVKFGS